MSYQEEKKISSCSPHTKKKKKKKLAKDAVISKPVYFTNISNIKTFKVRDRHQYQ